MLKWLWIAVLVVALDQITKQWASHTLQMYHPVKIIPMLNLFLAHNLGAAFNFLSDAGGWQRWLFTLIALVVSTVLVLWIRKLQQHERWVAVGLACILGGALGNVIDRIVFGHVIDFIQFYYHADSCLPGFTLLQSAKGPQCIWPSFNIADSAITVGAAILIIDAITGSRGKHQQAASKQEAGHG
ncbi:MAG: signal peptidase II [Gammaproteobacteria bacterium]|nr:signal peptidase II [Gammaproteobacteria bacterium]